MCYTVSFQLFKILSKGARSPYWGGDLGTILPSNMQDTLRMFGLNVNLGTEIQKFRLKRIVLVILLGYPPSPPIPLGL